MKLSIKLKSGVIAAGIAAFGLMGTQTALALNVKAEVFQKSESPWDMAFLQNGTMFFTEKCKGLSVRLPSGSVNKLLGVGGSKGYSSTKNDLFCDGQAGVQGVAIDPEFANAGFADDGDIRRRGGAQTRPVVGRAALLRATGIAHTG